MKQFFPLLNITANEASIFMFKTYNFLWFMALVIVVLPTTCGFNVTVAYLIIAKLRACRASFTRATYKMHLRMTACLLIQVIGVTENC